jgi:hypothetical protein
VQVILPTAARGQVLEIQSREQRIVDAILIEKVRIGNRGEDRRVAAGDRIIESHGLKRALCKPRRLRKTWIVDRHATVKSSGDWSRERD